MERGGKILKLSQESRVKLSKSNKKKLLSIAAIASAYYTGYIRCIRILANMLSAPDLRLWAPHRLGALFVNQETKQTPIEGVQSVE